MRRARRRICGCARARPRSGYPGASPSVPSPPGVRVVRIDLHTHSTASDGTDTPAELVRNAAAAGLDVVALTDHDTVARLRRGARRAARTGLDAGHRRRAVLPPRRRQHAHAGLPLRPRGARAARRARAGARRPGAARPGMVAKLQRAGRARHLGAGRADRRRRLRRAAARRHRAGRAGRRADRRRRLHRGLAGRRRPGLRREARDSTPSRRSGWSRARAGSPSSRTRPPPSAGRRVPESRDRASWPRPVSTASRSTTWTTTPTTRARLRGLAADWACWPPAPATTTAAARPVALGEYTTDPEVYGEITRRATGAFPVPGTGGA